MGLSWFQFNALLSSVVLSSGLLGLQAQAAITPIPGGTPILPALQPANTCPQSLPTLMPLLLRDLPAYANRVSQRSIRRERAVNAFGYVLVANQVDSRPLTLGPGPYQPAPEQSTLGDALQQTFITTLERTYIDNQSATLQDYHWLFLVMTSQGWRLSMMYSQTGNYPQDQPPTPPRESTTGTIGQAVSLWLRDCQAGKIRP